MPSGNKPLTEPMLMTYGTRGQWVKYIAKCLQANLDSKDLTKCQNRYKCFLVTTPQVINILLSWLWLHINTKNIQWYTATERRYHVMSSPIGWVHTKTDPWIYTENIQWWQTHLFTSIFEHHFKQIRCCHSKCPWMQWTWRINHLFKKRIYT